MPLLLFLALTLPAFFFCMLANAILGPLLVELAGDLNSSVAAMGLLAAMTALPWAIVAPIAGPFSDRYGRRPLILGGLVVTTLAVLASGLAWDYWSLAAFRFITGLGAALVPPNCTAAVSDFVPAERRGYAVSMMLGTFSLASLIGIPAVTFAAALGGWRTPFFGLAVALALTFVLFLLFFPGTERKRQARFDYAKHFAPLRKDRRPLMLLAANFTERTSLTIGTTYLASFLLQTYHVSLAEVAPALSVVAVGMLIGSVTGGPATTMRFRLKVCAAAQALTGVTAMVLFGTSPGFLISVAISFALGLFMSIGRPTILSLLVDTAPESRGTMTGLYAASNQTGTVVGAALGGLVIGLGGYSALAVVALATGLTGAVIAGWFIGEQRAAPEAVEA